MSSAFQQLRRRLDWAYPPEVMGAEMPKEAPLRVMPSVPPIDRPATVRAALALWWYAVAYYRNVWASPASQEAYRQIADLRIQYYGPQGWEKQPGWVDLAQRAEQVLRQFDVDPAALNGWKITVDSWVQQWDQEWAAASYSERLAIGRAWQAAYDEGLKKEIKKEVKERLPDAGGFGFGMGLAITGAALVALGLLFPDVALDQAKDTARRYRRVVKDT